jgi:hypothetical protein
MLQFNKMYGVRHSSPRSTKLKALEGSIVEEREAFGDDLALHAVHRKARGVGWRGSQSTYKDDSYFRSHFGRLLGAELVV